MATSDRFGDPKLSERIDDYDPHGAARGSPAIAPTPVKAGKTGRIIDPALKFTPATLDNSM
jgi:hypothetical protein